MALPCPPAKHSDTPPSPPRLPARPPQTTDWFASIQRCFHWSERIEQLPINGQLLAAREQELSAMSSGLASVGSSMDSTEA